MLQNNQVFGFCGNNSNIAQQIQLPHTQVEIVKKKSWKIFCS
jgi:hypothetical protein